MAEVDFDPVEINAEEPPGRSDREVAMDTEIAERHAKKWASLFDEFDYYVAHQAELAEKYQGRYLVIKNRRILGDYETLKKALHATVPEHEPGTFLLQLCDADPDSLKVTFRSRVRFA